MAILNIYLYKRVQSYKCELLVLNDYKGKI